MKRILIALSVALLLAVSCAHLWKKFPTIVEPELRSLGWFEDMIEFEEPYVTIKN